MYKMDKERLRTILANGGATLHYNHDGDFMDMSKAFSSGYGVSVKGGAVVDLSVLKMDDADFNMLIKKIIDFAKARAGGFVGLWVDGGKLYIDKTFVYNKLGTAMVVARDNNQLAIYDYANGKSIEVK